MNCRVTVPPGKTGSLVKDLTIEIGSGTGTVSVALALPLLPEGDSVSSPVTLPSMPVPAEGSST